MANIGGNFVNPAYASPEQIRSLREYAAQLLKEQPVQHWAQGLGNIARALVGGYESRQADVQEQASNRALQEGLQQAIQSGDLSQLVGMAGNPRVTPAMIALLLGTQRPEGTIRYGGPGGVSLEKPAPTMQERYNEGAPVAPVTQGGGLPPTQPTTPADVGGERLRPGQQGNVGEIIGTPQVTNIPPGANPNDVVRQGFADAGLNPKIPGVSPKESATLGGLADWGTRLTTQSQQYELANKENMGVIAKRPVAEQRLSNVKILKGLSDQLDDPAVIAKLKAKAVELGIPVGKTTNQYELFSSVTKRMAYQELQEAAATGRIPGMAFQDYSAANAQLWQTPAAREKILNAIAAPLDHDIRRAKFTNKYFGKMEPTDLWQKHTALPVDPNPLSHPTPPPQALDEVRRNPARLPDFIAAYGPGAAEDAGFGQ